MKHIQKLRFILIIICLSDYCNIAFAQINLPPVGKYNTTNYPKDRKAIAELQAKQGPEQFLKDDLIAVGPEGKISYGFEQWKKGFEDHNATFKSITPVAGTTVLRIYNGNAAVNNSMVDVVFDTPNGDFNITVVRTETYIKQNGQWYFVAGQGTRKMSMEEMKALEKQK